MHITYILNGGYRCLYNAVIDEKTEVRDYDMNIPNSGRGYKAFRKVVFSTSIGGFYLAIIGLITVTHKCVF